MHSLLASDSTSTPVSTENVLASTHPWASPDPIDHRVVLDVIDASGHGEKVLAVRKALASTQFTEGTIRTARSIRAASSIAYGTGARSAAEQLADNLGLSAIASDAVAPDTVPSPSAPILTPPITPTGSPPHRTPPQRAKSQSPPPCRRQPLAMKRRRLRTSR